MKTIRPPEELLGGIMYFAAAWAQRKAPFRFTSNILRHCEAGVEMLGTQPTMPAKQRSMEMEGVGFEQEDEEAGSKLLAFGVLRAMAASRMVRGTFPEVTSQDRSTIRAAGKSERRSWMAGWEDLRVDSISRRAMPLAPCSSRARADARARTPAPPVMMALPLTAKRARARSVADREG